MGVTYFMTWLAERYPLIFKRMDDPSKPSFDCLYIDFNSIIHFASNFFDPKQLGNFDQIIHEIIRYLITIVQIVKPNKLIYIAVDGTPPYNKCVVNRKQRLKEMMRKKNGKENSEKKLVFEIVAGSAFMEELHKKLLSFIQDKTKNDPLWSKPTVLYSSYHVPGEAEHKIIEFINQFVKQPYYNRNFVHCAFSIDSDMFFLALATKQPYFCIMRESTATADISDDSEFLKNEKATSSAFELLYVNLAREYLPIDFYPNDFVRQSNLDLEISHNFNEHLLDCCSKYDKLYDDFISLIFFIGNDFIPEFEELPQKKRTFDRILDCYKKTIVKDGLHIVNGNKFVPEAIDKLLDSMLLEAIVSGDTTSSAEERIGEQFSDILQKKDIINEICNKTLMNFDWVLQYYMCGKCPDWDFFYPFDVSPPLSLLKDSFKNYRQTNFVNKNNPLEPFESLLITCPIEGRTDLPKELSDLANKESDISRLFPHQMIYKQNSKEMREISFPCRNQFTEPYKKAISQINDPIILERNKIYNDMIINNGTSTFLSEQNILMTIGTKLENELLNEKEEQNSLWPPLYPSLFRPLIFSSFSLKPIGIHIFQEPSELNTLVANIKLRNPYKTAEELKELIGEEVNYDWPYWKPAIVYSISDQNTTYFLTDDCEVDEINTKSYFNISNTANEIVQSYLKRRGINITKPGIIIGLCPLKVATITEDAFNVTPEPIFTTQHLIQIQCDDNDITQSFMYKKPPQPTIGSDVVIIDGENKGEKGKIIEISENSCKIKLIVSRDPHLQSQEQHESSKEKKNDKNAWVKVQQVAQDVGMKFKVLKKAFASLPKNALRGNGNDIEIRVRALPSLYEIIGIKHKSQGNQRKQKENRAKPKITKLSDFMRDVERRLISLNIRTFEGEEVVESFDNIIWPGKHLQIMETFNEPGTRVMNVTNSDLIPFGTKGTIIEVRPSEFEVTAIADVEIPYGTTLGNRLITKRGFTAKFGDLISIESD